MHESPLCYCRIAREWIELDATFAACRAAHACGVVHCPLERLLRRPQSGDPLPAGWNARCPACITVEEDRQGADRPGADRPAQSMASADSSSVS